MYIDKSLRRQAEALGLRITKIPESSPRFAQYGPFILADLSTNGVVASSLEAEDIAGALNQLRPDHLTDRSKSSEDFDLPKGVHGLGYPLYCRQ